VVYTDVWTSMGQEDEQARRLADFSQFQVNMSLLQHAADDAIFMHCLPAHRGEEVDHDTMESAQSVVFDQAENRLHAQKAVLADLLYPSNLNLGAV
jgi:ornithine carbamoyltransferase